MSLDIEQIVREEIRHILRAHMEAIGFGGEVAAAIGRDTEPAPPPHIPAPPVRAPKPPPPKAKAAAKPNVRGAVHGKLATGDITGKELETLALADVTAGSWTSASVLAANIGNGVTARQAGDALQKLVKRGLIVAKGNRRGTRYFLPDSVPADAAQWAEGPTDELAAADVNGTP